MTKGLSDGSGWYKAKVIISPGEAALGTNMLICLIGKMVVSKIQLSSSVKDSRFNAFIHPSVSFFLSNVELYLRRRKKLNFSIENQSNF